MPGEILEQSTGVPVRWQPVNSLKNSRVTIQINCSWSGKKFNIPEKINKSTGDLQNYFDEAGGDDNLLGSTTLTDMVKRVKKNLPGLYLVSPPRFSWTCLNIII